PGGLRPRCDSGIQSFAQVIRESKNTLVSVIRHLGKRKVVLYSYLSIVLLSSSKNESAHYERTKAGLTAAAGAEKDDRLQRPNSGDRCHGQETELDITDRSTFSVNL